MELTKKEIEALTFMLTEVLMDVEDGEVLYGMVVEDLDVLHNKLLTEAEKV